MREILIGRTVAVAGVACRAGARGRRRPKSDYRTLSVARRRAANTPEGDDGRTGTGKLRLSTPVVGGGGGVGAGACCREVRHVDPDNDAIEATWLRAERAGEPVDRNYSRRRRCRRRRRRRRR